MKKAQVAGQVMIYVMGMIIISITIMYGYKAFVGWKQNAEFISYINFKNELSSSFEQMASEYKSVKIKTFTLPAGYSRMCFVDKGAYADTKLICDTATTTDNEPIVCNYWKDKAMDNAFLLGQKKTDVFFIGDPETQSSFFKVNSVDSNDNTISAHNQGYVCPQVRSQKFKLKLEGNGKNVLISQVAWS